MMDDKIMKTILPPVILSFAVALVCFQGLRAQTDPDFISFYKRKAGVELKIQNAR